MERNEIQANLNPLEYDIYFYLIQNKNKIISMKLKDIATQLHVSTAMITRVCKKIGFEGFGEYKAYVKLEEHSEVKRNTFELEHIFNFFHSIDNENFYQEIQNAANLIKESKDVIFYGIGLSGILAQYGHGLFNRKGIRSLFIEDFSMRLDFYDQAVAIILSVSGQTREVVDRISNLKSNGTKVILISENAHNDAAKMVDLCISYHLPNVKDQYFANSVTQVPVLYILECIANCL